MRAPLAVEGDKRPLTAHFVTENFFSELGTPARLGRLIDPGRDDAAGADPVVVLSHGFWQRHFGSDPLVVGTTVSLNNRPVAVIGVAAAGFGGLTMDDPDVWLPITRHPYFVKGSRLLTDMSAEDNGVKMWGRMRPGVTAAVVEDELRTLAATLRAQHPNDDLGTRTAGQPARRPSHEGRRLLARVRCAAHQQGRGAARADERAGAADPGGGLRQPRQPSAGQGGVAGPGDAESASPSAPVAGG